jgi:hypothetical protein
MEANHTSFSEIPDELLIKWQEIADLLAELISVPAALIMKTENEFMEVFVSSSTHGNPYHVGDKEEWYGLYCETVIKTQKKLLVPNALADEKWDKNPDIKLGMVSYLGFPSIFPTTRLLGRFVWSIPGKTIIRRIMNACCNNLSGCWSRIWCLFSRIKRFRSLMPIRTCFYRCWPTI